MSEDAINDHFQSEMNYTQKDGMTADTGKLTASLQLQRERWHLFGMFFQQANIYLFHIIMNE